MPRGYLDEMVPVNSGILGQYISPVGPFREPMYAMVDNDTVAATTPTRTRSSKPKKKKSNKPKNDGIIRNHDSVWDYKIQDGKLLTRRKSSDGKWYDITSNEEARQKIESFTGRSIGSKQNTATNQGSKQATTPKSNTTTTPSNTSQSQPSKPASTAQTQQTTRPAATQPARQQAARQDSTRQQTTQPRSLAATRGSNTEPDWQNMTDDEVAAYFSGSPLGGVTKTGKGNPNKKNELLSAEDLAANGWHWSNGNDYPDSPYLNPDGTNHLQNEALLRSARQKSNAGDNILLDSNGAIVPTSEVRRYINRGRIPLYISDYDAQFYQPQSENGTLRDIRRAQDIRRNQAFDRQRNAALATMFSLPALGIAGATAPLTTMLALGGSELVGAGFEGAWKHATGNTWAQSLGANDPTGQFYADMLQPGRAIGGFLGGYAANATQPARQAVGNIITRGFNNIVGNGENPSLIGLLRRQAYVNRPSGFSLPARQPQAVVEQVTPKAPKTLKGTTGKGNSLSEAKARTKAYWEERQPYQVTIKKGKDGRLYPKFNVKQVNTRFDGYPHPYPIPPEGLIRKDPLYLMKAYQDMLPYGSRDAVNMLKDNLNMIYDLPAGYWQSVRPVPTYLDSPRFRGIVLD